MAMIFFFFNVYFIWLYWVLEARRSLEDPAQMWDLQSLVWHADSGLQHVGSSSDQDRTRPQPGLPALELGVLATGPPGQSLQP